MVELRTDLRKRGIDICSSQEMRLCGAKSYSIEHERGKNIYKLPCFGRGFRDAIKEIERRG